MQGNRSNRETAARPSASSGPGAFDPLARDAAEEVALVAHGRRSAILRAHRFRLRHEDLEDCYGQATFELIRHTLRGGRFASRQHIANVLEQRFLSRVHDHRRAVEGRSPARAMAEGAFPLDAGGQPLEVHDPRSDTERLVLQREELRRLPQLAGALSREQRLVLASQLADIPGAELCSRLGWSSDKYRKLAQRARRRLRVLGSSDAAPVPSDG